MGMVTRAIDLNLDAGESATALADGSEAALYDIVTSVNIACGGHAGNVQTMTKAVELASARRLNIGAHPSYPDFTGFGRTAMNLTSEALTFSLMEQIENLLKIIRGAGVHLTHVKPHGALYHRAATDRSTAGAMMDAVKRVAPGVAIIGLAGSPLRAWCEDSGHRFLAEAFADRRYETDGRLRSRELADALITDPAEAGGQAIQLVTRHQTESIDTLCIHGDSPHAMATAAAIREALNGAGVLLRPFAPTPMGR